MRDAELGHLALTSAVVCLVAHALLPRNTVHGSPTRIPSAMAAAVNLPHHRIVIESFGRRNRRNPFWLRGFRAYIGPPWML